jgi:hypothetical protein
LLQSHSTAEMDVGGLSFRTSDGQIFSRENHEGDDAAH